MRRQLYTVLQVNQSQEELAENDRLCEMRLSAGKLEEKGSII